MRKEEHTVGQFDRNKQGASLTETAIQTRRRGSLELIYTGYCIGGKLTEGGAVRE